jgi:hypothetical protein
VSRDVLVLACAVSAGVHAALAPRHPSFLPAAAALAALAVGLARSDRKELVDGAIVVLAGLIGSYALAVTTGIPILHPEPDEVTGLGLATKAVEAAGVLAALQLKGAFQWTSRTPTVRSRWR